MRALPGIGILLIGPFITLAATARAETFHVPGTHPTIALANAAAFHGDTIVISPGRYQESILCTKRLVFQGLPGTIWDGAFDGAQHDQLTAVEDSVEVRGIEFQNGGRPIRITGDDAVISACRFRSNGQGVLVDGARARVSQNAFTGLQNASSPAIDVDGPLAVVTRNRIENCTSAGISVDSEGGGRARVSKNRLRANQAGGSIEVRNADAAFIQKNLLENSSVTGGGAIQALDCDDARLVGNRLRNLDQDAAVGLRVTGARAELTRNSVINLIRPSGGFKGIFVTGEGARVIENRIEASAGGDGGDSYGIQVTGASAAVLANQIIALGGGGGTAAGIVLTGAGAAVSNNTILRLHDEFTIGIQCLGNTAVVRRNTVAEFQNGSGIFVSGEDYLISRNRVSDGAHGTTGIRTWGGATSSGAARVERNRIADLGFQGLHCQGDNLVLGNNRISQVAGAGVIIEGASNQLTGDRVKNAADDAFRINGDGNQLSACVARNGDRDGFDITGTGNTLDQCVARNFAAEGLDNGGGQSTVATDCSLSQSRIDYAGNGGMAADSGTTYTTGGAGVPPEID